MGELGDRSIKDTFKSTAAAIQPPNHYPRVFLMDRKLCQWYLPMVDTSAAPALFGVPMQHIADITEYVKILLKSERFRVLVVMGAAGWAKTTSIASAGITQIKKLSAGKARYAPGSGGFYERR